MDLSPAQRVLAFVGIVVVLGGMGAYLLIPGVRSAVGQEHKAAGATPTSSASGARGTAATAPARSTAPAASESPVPTPAGSAPDIYQWLPFSKSDLAKAASVTEAFGAAYDMFSYRESTSSYLASLRGLTTSELAATLGAPTDAGGGQPAHPAEAGLVRPYRDQLHPHLRAGQPDLRGDHRPDDPHQAGEEPEQRAVRGHPDRERAELAGQRRRAGLGRKD